VRGVPSPWKTSTRAPRRGRCRPCGRFGRVSSRGGRLG
jgi:hypothetical protein